MEPNKTKSNVIGRKQRAALPFFCDALPIEKQCQAACVPKSTFYAWLKNPAFLEALEQARHEVTADALQRITLALSAAVDTITDLLSDESAGVRLRAANILIEAFMKITSLTEIEKRLSKLENENPAVGKASETKTIIEWIDSADVSKLSTPALKELEQLASAAPPVRNFNSFYSDIKKIELTDDELTAELKRRNLPENIMDI